MGKVRSAVTADAAGKGTKNMQARIDRAARAQNKHLFADDRSASAQQAGRRRKSDVIKVPRKPPSSSGATASATTKRRLSKAEKRRLKKAGKSVSGAGVVKSRGASSSSSAAAAAPRHPHEPEWRKHLTKFYTKHNPSKLTKDPGFVEALLHRIDGKELGFKTLFATLNEKYPVGIGPVSYTHLTLPTIYSV